MFFLPRGVGQLCIRHDLIAKELSCFEEKYHQRFSKYKLTNRFMDWLFRRYETLETTINFYDYESEIMDGMEDPEEYRMTFNNWTDPIGCGIWDMSQRQADLESKRLLVDFRSAPFKKKDRVYYMNTGDIALIYCYGRDFCGVDYWVILKKKGLDI